MKKNLICMLLAKFIATLTGCGNKTAALYRLSEKPERAELRECGCKAVGK